MPLCPYPLPVPGSMLSRPYPRFDNLHPSGCQSSSERFVVSACIRIGDVRVGTFRGVNAVGFFLPRGRLRLPDTFFESADNGPGRHREKAGSSMAREIVEKAGGAKLRLSFGGAQVEVNREPALRDKVYLLVAGHFSQTKLAPGDADFLLATVTGTAQVISHAQFLEYGGTEPAEQLELEPSAQDLEKLEAELVEAGR